MSVLDRLGWKRIVYLYVPDAFGQGMGALLTSRSDFDVTGISLDAADTGKGAKQALERIRQLRTRVIIMNAPESVAKVVIDEATQANMYVSRMGFA